MTTILQHTFPFTSERTTPIYDEYFGYEPTANFPLFNIESFTATGTSMTINGTGDLVASVFRAPKTGNISHVGYGLVGITGAQPTYKASVETVTGATSTRKFPIPSGTLWAAGTTGTFVPSGSNIFVWVTLGTEASVTINDVVAATIRYSSGTIGGSNYAEFRVDGYMHTNHIRGLPLAVYDDGLAEIE